MKQEEKNKKKKKIYGLLPKKQDFTNKYGEVKKLKLGHKNRADQ